MANIQRDKKEKHTHKFNPLAYLHISETFHYIDAILMHKIITITNTTNIHKYCYALHLAEYRFESFMITTDLLNY